MCGRRSRLGLLASMACQMRRMKVRRRFDVPLAIANVALAPRLLVGKGRSLLTQRTAFTHLLELSPEEAEAELERELAALELSERRSGQRPSPRSSTSSRSSLSVGSASDAADLSTLHANLRERLRGFLAQKLGGRHVRVTVKDEASDRVLSSGLLLTAEDGTFRHTLPILVPAGETWEGRRLVVHVELQLEPAEERGAAKTAEHTLTDSSTLEIFPTGSVRIVSDLDDTVKHTQVLAGTRQILRNVFTRPYDECVPQS